MWQPKEPFSRFTSSFHRGKTKKGTKQSKKHFFFICCRWTFPSFPVQARKLTEVFRDFFLNNKIMRRDILMKQEKKGERKKTRAENFDGIIKTYIGKVLLIPRASWPIIHPTIRHFPMHTPATAWKKVSFFACYNVRFFFFRRSFYISAMGKKKLHSLWQWLKAQISRVIITSSSPAFEHHCESWCKADCEVKNVIIFHIHFSVISRHVDE